MAKEQRYGVSFPITVTSDDKTLFDLNRTRAEQVKSEIMHLIFTPQGQRLRRPTFGTRLVQFIFNSSTNDTFSDIVSEIKSTVSMWIPTCTIDEVEVAESENGLELFARIKYTLTENGETNNYELISKL